MLAPVPGTQEVLHKWDEDEGDDGESLALAFAWPLPAMWSLSLQNVTFSMVRITKSKGYFSCTSAFSLARIYRTTNNEIQGTLEFEVGICITLLLCK